MKPPKKPWPKTIRPNLVSVVALIRAKVVVAVAHDVVVKKPNKVFGKPELDHGVDLNLKLLLLRRDVVEAVVVVVVLLEEKGEMEKVPLWMMPFRSVVPPSVVLRLFGVVPCNNNVVRRRYHPLPLLQKIIQLDCRYS